MKPGKEIDLIVKIITGKHTDREKIIFDEWLHQSEKNQEFFKKVKILWEKTNAQYDSLGIDEAAARENIRKKILHRHVVVRKVNTRFWIPAAASVLLLLALGLFAGYLIRNSQSNYIAYTSGLKIREIVLPDSSHVWLNENSTLKAPLKFTGNQRKVFLSGEAYFEVRHNDVKSFKVMAGKMVIKDLGTAFDVKMNVTNGDVSVVVHSGRVAFYRSFSLFEKAILKPDQKGQYLSSGGKVNVSVNRNMNYLSWKTGVLTFYNAPLDKVCRELSDHYRKTVISEIRDSSLVLTGSFQDETLDEVLKTIELTLNIKIDQTQKEIIIRN